MTDGRITTILRSIEAGEARASEQLLPLVYDELRAIAARRMRQESPGNTLQATALVHEAWLRLLDSEGSGGWDSRAHFFMAAAEAMRRILIDRARARGALKRGGGRRRLALDVGALSLDDTPPEILDLDAALERLRAEDPVKADLVKLRFFAGLTMDEAASILGISPATADRYWAYARAWLYSEMGGAERTDG